MTRQLSLMVLACVVLASFFVMLLTRPPIAMAQQYQGIGLVTDINQKGRLTEFEINDILVKSFLTFTDIRPGDEIAFEGKLVDVRDENQKYYSKGYSNYLQSKGIYYTVQSSQVKRIANEINGYSVRDKVRRSMEAKLDVIYGKEAPIVKALIYGDRNKISDEMNALFAKTGTAHVLALSGFHVGILTALIALIFYKVPVKKRGLIAIFLLLLYGFLTGLRPSILRAILFFGIFYLSFLLNQRYNLFASACLCAAILLAYNPYYIYDRGFTLSFAGVSSIALFYPMLRLFFYGSRWYNNKIFNALFITIAAQMLILPLSMYYFGSFSTVAILANLLVVPIISLMMTLALLSLILSYVTGALPMLFLPNQGVVATVKLLQKLLLEINTFFAKISFSSIEIEISFWQMMGLYAGIFALYILWEIYKIKENQYEPKRAQQILREE